MQTDSRTLRVAAAQLTISDQIDANLSSILASMKRCAADGVEIVVFPETALTGYSPTIGQGREPGEWPTIRASLDAVGRLASELGIWVVVGSEARSDGTWVNRLCAFSDAGDVVATYDKVHLTSADTQYYRPGTSNTVFDMKGIVIGLQICYDARFPEGYRSLLAQGAEVVLQGFFGAGKDTWKVPVLGAHLRARAAENGVFVVAANVAGPLQIVVSQIVDPLGLVLAQANQDREELIQASLDLGQVARSEIRRDCLSRFKASVLPRGS